MGPRQSRLCASSALRLVCGASLAVAANRKLGEVGTNRYRPLCTTGPGCCKLCDSVYNVRMPNPRDILGDALRLPDKDELSPHLPTICALRDKGYSWRDIADFLRERGVETEHTKVFRLYTKHRSQVMNIPDAHAYADGLKAIRLTQAQSRMLEHHYSAHNRTVTYTELAKSAGSGNHRIANSAYGKLGRALGEAIGFMFPIAGDRGEPFYSGSIGIDAPRTATNEYRLMMHHELAKAIDLLGWFKK